MNVERDKTISFFLWNDLLSMLFFIDNVQKCYMCTSLTNDGCGSELIPSLVEPTECTENNMIIWQGQIKQHNVLNSIVWLFEISEPRQHYEGAQDIACLKMTLNGKQSGAKQEKIT